MKIKNNSNTNIPVDYIYIILLGLFPLALISGNFLTNFFIFLFSINFFLNFKENKKFLKNGIFYLLIFFFISLLINVFFSLNPENSLPRVLKIFFIIIFIFEVKRLILNYEITYIKYVFTSWYIIFFLITLDVIFELTYGYNLIGNKSYMTGRIASFFGDELVVGAFYHGFVLFFLSYLVLKKSKIHTMVFFIIIVLVISFFIGERSNFIKLFFAVVFFASFALQINYKIKIITFIIAILTVIALFNISVSDKIDSTYKSRYFNQIKMIFQKNGYSNFLKNTQYGAHRDAAFKIFKENVFFGIGIKNFRYESGKKKYENKEYALTNRRQATHPHQIHYEFLSETGIFGYLSFLIFMLLSIYRGLKSYLRSRNLYQFSAIIFIVTSLLPFLPSGSFLSTFTSGIFWLNFAIMNAYIKH